MIKSAIKYLFSVLNFKPTTKDVSIISKITICLELMWESNDIILIN